MVGVVPAALEFGGDAGPDIDLVQGENPQARRRRHQDMVRIAMQQIDDDAEVPRAPHPLTIISEQGHGPARRRIDRQHPARGDLHALARDERGRRPVVAAGPRLQRHADEHPVVVGPLHDLALHIAERGADRGAGGVGGVYEVEHGAPRAVFVQFTDDGDAFAGGRQGHAPRGRFGEEVRHGVGRGLASQDRSRGRRQPQSAGAGQQAAARQRPPPRSGIPDQHLTPPTP